MSDFYSKLIKVQATLNAPKGQYNSFGKYAYRSCEDIMGAVKPLLAEHGLVQFVSDEIVLIGDRYYVKATVTVTDGKESHTATAFARESLQKKGMDDAQITGATSSYARKYALNGMYNIDDTKDADTNEYRQQATQKANQAVKQQATGFNPQECLSKFVNLASSADMETLQSSFKQVWTSLKGYPEQSKAKEVYDLRKSELENSQEQING
ncbi:recombination protein [Vibrio phage vB_VpP_BT-1011]|uniref:Recombination protein n=1 Tax=Vibrio phage vB_VpP_BT-1011 TaxID=2799672 RepID=A0A8F2XWZ3_9CAUD|nr:recombination protein [Vibrio phage vB_VpP_BT-1011]QWX10237.1 recombination protein [Vibrio phage vB_VpP_BT-1011]